MDTTYRLIAVGDNTNVGQTAATPELAKLVPGNLYREGKRLGIERTEWTEHFEKPKIARTILIEAESRSGEWKIGPDADQPPPLDKVVAKRQRTRAAVITNESAEVFARPAAPQPSVADWTPITEGPKGL